ncbi:MAG TPA: TorF family putative porin [Burkholderiaceae bacterium]
MKRLPAVVSALLGLSLLAVSLPSQAEEAASPLSFNIGATTDYRYRGISQSRLKPALQGGADYALPNGFYIGTWGSTIKWIKDGGGDANVEVDLYGGYKTELVSGVTLDVGLLKYLYPSNALPVSANTLEFYGALTMGVFTAKYSRSTSNLFGFSDSKGSEYFDLSAAIDLGDGFSLTPHVGYQKVRHNEPYTYTDFALTLAKDLGDGLSISGALLGTDAKKVYLGPNGKDLGKASAVLAIKKSF